jgi:hypothetical protein
VLRFRCSTGSSGFNRRPEPGLRSFRGHQRVTRLRHLRCTHPRLLGRDRGLG